MLPKPQDLNNTEARFGGGEGFSHLPSGIYVCVIKSVSAIVDNNAKVKEWLEYDYDIKDGEYAGYFEEQYKRMQTFTDIPSWYATARKYYTDKALPYFKGFIKRIIDSNPKFSIRDDYSGLAGKEIVLSIQAVEKTSKAGKNYWRYDVKNEYSKKELAQGKDYNGKPLAKYEDKPLDNTASGTTSTASSNEPPILKDDIQF